MVETFKIAAYTRISVDLELDRDNTSIENQKAIIGEYCRLHFPTSTVDYFEDRDKSGYTFEQRPDYMRMREMLVNHEYDILIVKDLSRFSRRTGKGLAEFEELSEHDSRIIAIGDGVDYYQDHIDDWMKIKLYFFVNEMPVTDTSRKVLDVIGFVCNNIRISIVTLSQTKHFETERVSSVLHSLLDTPLDVGTYTLTLGLCHNAEESKQGLVLCFQGVEVLFFKVDRKSVV